MEYQEIFTTLLLVVLLAPSCLFPDGPRREEVR